MKAPLIFFLLSALLPAKTWIELAKDADYHLDHPGRLIDDPVDDPQRLEYLKLNAEAVAEIFAGDPAVLPVDSFDFEKESATGDLMLGLLRVSEFTALQAKRQEWNDVNALLDLARKAHKRILASEPSLVWFLVAIAPSRTAFQCLDELPGIDDVAKREAVFAILKSHWEHFRATRSDFALTEKNETRFAREMTRDFKDFLRSLPYKLDAKPIFWDEEFPHELTVREILEFPLDDEQYREDTLADLKKEYQWIRSDKPFTVLKKTLPKRPPREPAFYRSHPNGLGELMGDAISPHQNATTMMRSLQRDRLREVVWHWLSLERTGAAVTRADQVTALMSRPLKKDIETLKIELLPKERLITAPDDFFFGQIIENRLTVPDLFPK